MMSAIQQRRATIVYDNRDHMFALSIDGAEVSRVPSHVEAEHLRDAFFRAEDVLSQVTFPEGRIVLTVTEAAKALGMDRDTLMEYIQRGELRAFQVGERTVRISLNALTDWISKQERTFAALCKPDPTLLSHAAILARPNKEASMAKRREKGDGSVYRRKSDDLWVGQNSKTVNGKTTKRTFYGKTKREVLDKLKAFTIAQAQGFKIGSDKETVEQYMNRWLEDVARRRIRATSFRSYESKVRIHIVPILGNIPVAKLTPDDVQHMLNAMADLGLSQGTMSRTRGVLHTALEWLVRTNVLQRNPTSYTDIPRTTKKKTRRVLVDLDMADRILEATATTKIRTEVIIGLRLGVRSGELRALTWSDIDLDGAKLYVRSAVTYIGGEYSIGDTKTEAGEREIPLDEELVDELRRHKVRQMELRLRAGSAWVDHNLVFPNRDGNYRNPHSLLRAFNIALANAGLPHLRWHDLRHGCASILAAQGVEPVAAMEILGHASIAITLGVYTRASEENKRKAIERVGQALKAKRTG